MKLVFATGNNNKAREIQTLMPDGIEVLSLADLEFYEEIPETGKTLEENAKIKAAFVHEKFGLNCFADDTGLEIEALNGEPGVYSARYAGPHRNDADNIQKVLAELKKHKNKKARFRTVISLVINGKFHEFEGIVNGNIITKPTGENGFGYDPIFEPEECGKTFAEMTIDEKNQRSHRARAFHKLIDFIQNHL